MDINFEYYKIFYYVAKYKNITRAAAALGSSQPNVTRVMKLLEEGLHCKLLVREARGIALTREGERLYAYVEIAFHQLLKAQEEIGAQLPDGTGTVEIGATETALHLFLLDALRAFKEIYPKARIKIHNHTTPDSLKRLAYGGLDFAVVTTPFELTGQLTGKRLAGFREILVGGEQYRQLGLGKLAVEETEGQRYRQSELGKPIAEEMEGEQYRQSGLRKPPAKETEGEQSGAAAYEPWSLQDLRGYPWVGIGAGTATCELYREYFFRQKVNLEPDMEVATSDLLIPLIRAGMGIGFVPEQMAKPWLEAGQLVRIPLLCEPPEREIVLVCDSGRGGSALSERLQKYLQNVVREPKSYRKVQDREKLCLEGDGELEEYI